MAKKKKELTPYYIENVDIDNLGGGASLGGNIGLGGIANVEPSAAPPVVQNDIDFIEAKEMRIGKGTQIFGADSNGIFLGSGKFSDAPFRVSMAGALTSTSATIAGWTIGATTISSAGNEIVLDSSNKRIEVGASDEIVLDGTNKKITVGTSSEIIIDGSNAKITVGTANKIYIDGVNKRIQSDNYTSGPAGAGFHLSDNLLEVGNIACRGLIRTAVFQKDVINVMGGNFAVLDGDVLDADMSALDASTLTTKGTTTFVVGDILRIKDGTDDEWMEITDITSAPTYTVTRDKAGDYDADDNPAWKKGATVVNYKQSGDGGILMTASESNAPYLSIFTHAGSPWSTLTTRLRIGNLNGYLGYTTDKYGIAIGEITKFLKYDPTNGLTIEGGKIQTSNSGQRIVIDGADNYIKIYDSSNQIGAIGSSLDATDRYIDFNTPIGTDVEMVKLLAQKTDGTEFIFTTTSKGYQSIRLRNENNNSYRNTNGIPVLDIFNLGTGIGIKVGSSSSYDTLPFNITLAKSTSTNPIFKITQSAVVSTNIRKIFNEVNTGCTMWISDGTTPNGNLSGQAGDICLNGDSGNIYRCSTTGTTWVAM